MRALDRGWQPSRARGIFRPCLTAQENARKTQTSLQSWSLTLQPTTVAMVTSQKTLLQWPSEDEEASKGARPELTSLAVSSDLRSLLRPLGRGGERAKMSEDEIGSNSFIETELGRRIKALEALLNADVVTVISPIHTPLDDWVRNAVEDITQKRKAVAVIIETEGGSIETAERIANLFRHHYPDYVSFLVPNFAMSAGTILVMSGDDIFMDYYSVLGPIDPQVRNQSGAWVPALGYLEKYDQLIKKSGRAALTHAELAFLVSKFDPAELHRFEQARGLSIDLLKKWLVRYKFKNWAKTRTAGKTVTQKMKEKRAELIAKKLNDTKKWRSHGRGLSLAVLENDVDLIIEDLSKTTDLHKEVRDYYRLLQD